MSAPRRLLTLIAVGIIISVSGCGQQSSDQSTQTTKTAIRVTSTPSGMTSNAPESTIADDARTFRNGGATIRLISATQADKLSLDPFFVKDPEGPSANPSTGKIFILVRTRVTNDSRISMKLTCLPSIDTYLIDHDRRKFIQADDLYEIVGNPGCDELLEPRSSTDMTWVYEVPKGARIAGWAFADHWAKDGFTFVRITTTQ